MISNGNSFGNGQSISNGQSMLRGERRNTETWYWRMLGRIQPGAAS